jgi:hypothetical protein
MRNTTMFENVEVCRDDVVYGANHICSIVYTNLDHKTRTNLINELLQFRSNVSLCFLVPSLWNPGICRLQDLIE